MECWQVHQTPFTGHVVKFLSGEKKDKEVSNVPMSCVIVVSEGLSVMASPPKGMKQSHCFPKNC